LKTEAVADGVEMFTEEAGQELLDVMV